MRRDMDDSKFPLEVVGHSRSLLIQGICYMKLSELNAAFIQAP